MGEENCRETQQGEQSLVQRENNQCFGFARRKNVEGRWWWRCEDAFEGVMVRQRGWLGVTVLVLMEDKEQSD